MTSKKTELYTLQLLEYNFPRDIITTCGEFSEQTILTFMRRMASKRIPASSCLSYMHARYENNNQATMSLDEDGGMIHECTNPKSVIIQMTMKACRDCDKHSCHTNIINGKCGDEFIRSTLGQAFFTQHYCKQK